MAKFCSHCGASINDTSKFCPTCGQEVVSNASTEPAASGSFDYDVEHYIPDERFVDMFFRYDNRLNRKRYFLRSMALMGILLVVSIILSIICGSESTVERIVDFVGLVLMVPHMMLVVRRLHDLSQPTWWFIGMPIPILNIVLGLYLLFARGTIGPNQYGPDPLEGQD